MARRGPQRTPELEQEILHRFGAGQGRKDIARTLGIRYQTVASILENLSPSYVHGNRKFTQEQEQEIFRAIAAHERVSAVARRYNCHPQTLRQLLRRQGVGLAATRRRTLTDAEKTDAITALQKGDTKQVIARRLGVHLSLLTKLFTERGLTGQRRPRFGPNSPNWKGGRRTAAAGYQYVRLLPGSPFAAMTKADGYVMEHRLVMAEYLGRPLLDYETVHHVNGIPGDNRIENLQLRIGNHGVGRAFRCADCGSHNIEAVPIL